MFEQIQKIIADTLKIENDLISITSSLEELKIDSLDFYEIALKIEEKFNVEIDGYDLEYVKTVQDILFLISK